MNIYFYAVIVIFFTSINGRALANTAKDIDRTYYSPLNVGDYLSGVYAARTKDSDTASEIFTQALKESPNNPVFVENGYKINLKLGNIDQSADLAQKYSEMAQANSDINLLIATKAINNRNYSEALRILNLDTSTYEEITVSSSINRVINPFLKIWATLGMGNTAEVKLMLSEELKKNSTPSLFTYYQSALIHYILGNIPETEANLSNINLNYEGLPYHFVKKSGIFYESIQKTDTALSLYSKYQDSLPDSKYFDNDIAKIKGGEKTNQKFITDAKEGFSEVLAEAARVLYNSGYYDELLPYLQLALYLQPTNDEMKMILASTYENSNNYLKAVEIYQTIPASSDFYLKSRVLVAHNLYDHGDKQSAYDHLTYVIDKSNIKSTNFAVLTLADLYRKDLQFEKASILYSKVLENSDEKSINDWSIYFARGICFERINNWNLAEKDLLHALKLEPQQPDLLNYLGYSWIDRNKNLEEATQMVVAAVKARPNDPQIIDSMGWIFFKSQNYDMAAEYLEKAAEITPYDSVINDHLGDTYWKQGRHNEAIFQWKRALKYDARKDLSVIDVNNKIENGLDGLGNKS